MSDTPSTDPYDDGSVPADADLNPDASDVVDALPGGGRLDEGEDDGLTAEQVRPDGTALP